MIEVGDTVRIVKGDEVFIGQEATVMEKDSSSAVGMTWYRCQLRGARVPVWFEERDIEKVTQEGKP